MSWISSNWFWQISAWFVQISKVFFDSITSSCSIYALVPPGRGTAKVCTPSTIFCLHQLSSNYLQPVTQQKQFSGFSTPSVDTSLNPQLAGDAWLSFHRSKLEWVQTSTVHGSVSSTKSTPIVSSHSQTIGAYTICPSPPPRDLQSLTRRELNSGHSMGSAPFLWHMTCSVLSMLPPVNLLDWPQTVLKQTLSARWTLSWSLLLQYQPLYRWALVPWLCGDVCCGSWLYHLR